MGVGRGTWCVPEEPAGGFDALTGLGELGDTGLSPRDMIAVVDDAEDGPRRGSIPLCGPTGGRGVGEPMDGVVRCP